MNIINKKASNYIYKFKKPKKLLCFFFVLIFALSLVAYASFFDNRVPQLEIISPLNNSTVSQDVQIEVNAKAYHEIYEVTLNINDGASWQKMEKISGDQYQGAYVYVWNTNGIPDGQYDLTIKLLDTFGHVRQEKVTIFVQNTTFGIYSAANGDISEDTTDGYYYLSLGDLDSKTNFVTETEEIEETFIVEVEKTERNGKEVTITGTLSFDGSLPESFWFNVTGDTGQLLNYEFIPELPDDSVQLKIEDTDHPLCIQIDGNAINETETYSFVLSFQKENNFDGKIKVGTGTTVVLIYEASVPPIIGGYLNATSGEWDDAFKAASGWESESGGNPPFDISAFVMKNSTHIFVAFNISDSTISPYGDYAVVYFDVDNDAPPPPLIGDPAIDDHGYGIIRIPDDSFRGEREGNGTSTGREGWYDTTLNKWRYWTELTPSTEWKSGFYENNSYWSTELAIPYEYLGISSPDDVIGIKFLYGDRYGDESADLIEYVWPPGGGNPDEPTGDLDAEDDTASYGDAYLDPNAPIVWDLTVNPSYGEAGTTYDFTATVTNSTSAEIDSVTIRITLPDETIADDIPLANSGGDIWTGYWDSTGKADSIYYLTVIATDLQPDSSIVNNMAYLTVDTTPPVTTISFDGTMGLDDWYASNVTVTLTTSDISGVTETSYSFDEISWFTYTAPFEISTEGNTTIYYNSTDFLGHMETTKNDTLKIDKTPPNIENPAESADPVEYNVNETITCSITEPVDTSGVQTALLWYKIGIGGTWTSLDLSGGSADILETQFAYSDGTIYYYVYGLDVAGNLLYKYDGGLTTTNETTAQANPYNVTIQDTTPPDISDPTESADPVEYNVDETITCNVTEPTDASGVQTALFWYRIGESGTWTSMDLSGGTSNILETAFAYSDGTIYYYIYGLDVAGNLLYKYDGGLTTTNEATAQANPYNVTIQDTTPPDISDPTESADPVEYNVDETITCSVTDPDPGDGSGIQTTLLWYKIGIGGMWTSLDLSGGSADILETQFAYSDGTIYYYIYGLDVAGNLLYKYDGGLTTTNEATAQANPYNVTIQDTTPLDISDPIESADPVEYNADETITCSATDPDPGDGSGLQTALLWYRIGAGGSWTSLDISSGSAIIPETAFAYNDGTIYYYIYGIDAAGNLLYKYDGGLTTTNEATAQANPYDVTIQDTTPPDISDPTESADPVEYSADETITCSVSDPDPGDGSGVQTALLWYRIGAGGSWTSLDISSGSAIIPETAFAYNDGTIYYYIYGIDAAGNLLYKYDGGLTTTNEATAQANPYDVTIQDTTPPDISDPTESADPVEYNVDETITCNVTEPTDASGTQISLLWYRIGESGTWTSLDISLGSAIIPETAFAYSDGTIYYYIYGLDVAGNLLYKYDGGLTTTNEATAQANPYDVTIQDTTPPDISVPSESADPVEYNADETITCSVSDPDPGDGSGVQTALLWYRIGESGTWISLDISLGSAIIPETAFAYSNGTIYYYISAEDNADLSQYRYNGGLTSDEGTARNNPFTVVIDDTTLPDIDVPGESADPVEYNADETITCSITEPADASGVQTAELWYRIGAGGSWTSLDISSGAAIIPETAFAYSDGIIYYYIFAEDYAGLSQYRYNGGLTTNVITAINDPFTVVIDDTTPPDIGVPTESADPVEYNVDETITCSVTEPVDASGVQTVLLWYRIGAGGTWTSLDIGSGSAAIPETAFAYSDGTIYYYIFAEDNEGASQYRYNGGLTSDEGTAQADPFTVTIGDTTPPDIGVPTESADPVEYDIAETITCSATDPDPGEGSGVQTVLLWYRIGAGGTWTSLDLNGGSAIIPETQFAYSDGTVYYYISAEDTAGASQYRYNGGLTSDEGTAQADPFTVTIGDTTPPDISDPIDSSNPVPYDQDVTITCSVSEPTDASGVDTALLWYKIGASGTWTSLDLSSGSVTIPETEFEYEDGAIYYYIYGEDNVGNDLYKYNGDLTTPDEGTAQADPYVIPIVSSGPVIGDPVESADPVNYYENETITCSVTDPPDGPGIYEALLWYRIGESGTWIALDISGGSADILETAFAYSDGTIYYYIYAEDNAGVSLYKYNGGFTTTDVATAQSDPYTVTIDDDVVPNIGDPTESADPVEYNVDETITCSVTDADPGEGSGVQTVLLWYRIGAGGTWTSLDLSSGSAAILETVFAYGDGTIYYYIYAVDLAGNSLYKYDGGLTTANEATAQANPYDVTIQDTTLPDIGVPSESADPVEYNADEIITCSITEPADASGVQTVLLWYRIGAGGTWASLDLSSGSAAILETVFAYGDGTIYYYIFAADYAGLSQYRYSGGLTSDEGTAQADPFTVTIDDTTPPDIGIPSESEDPVEYNVDEIITCIATDPDPGEGSGVQTVLLWYRIGAGGTWTSLDLNGGFATIPETAFTYSDGTIYYYISAEDNAGASQYRYNGGLTSDEGTAQAAPFTVTIGDTTDPSATIDEPAEDSWVGGVVILESTPYDDTDGSGVAIVSWEYTLDDGAAWTVIIPDAGVDGDALWNSTYPTVINDDTGVKLRLNVTDNAGNTFSMIISLAGVDNILPDIGGTEPDPIPSKITDQMAVTVHIDETAFNDDNGIDWSAGIILHYSTNGGNTWTPLTMSLGGSYNATIPKQSKDTTVLYYVEVKDLAGNSVTTSTHSYTVQSSGGGGGGGGDGGGDDGGTTTKTMLLTLLTEVPSAVTQGTRVTIRFSLTDSSGNGIEGAIVSLTVGNTSIICTDLGEGIYTATIDTSDMSFGDYDMTISASKEDYETTTKTLTLTINRPIPMMLIGAIGLVGAIALAGIVLAFRRAGITLLENETTPADWYICPKCEYAIKKPNEPCPNCGAIPPFKENSS